MMASILRYLRPAGTLPREVAMRRFQTAARQLKPRDIAIDCGANVGRFTLQLAASGATVHAFEPNPAAFAVLQNASTGRSNIVLHQKAVAAEPSTVKLYLHEHAAEDPVKWSTGSSVLSYKGNVDTESFVTVEAIDLAAFIVDVGPVAILKVDIEGAEVELLERLINLGLHKNIGHIFVETHDHKIPQLAGPTNALRRRISEMGISNINLDWE